MAEAERRRRRRPALSCTPCRTRKIRCNRGNPCSSCVRSRNSVCVYDPLPAIESSKNGSSDDGMDIDGPSLPVRASSKLASSAASSNVSRSPLADGTHASTPATQLSSLDAVAKRPTEPQPEREDMPDTVMTFLKPWKSYTPSQTTLMETTIAHVSGTYSVMGAKKLSDERPVIVRNIKHKTRLFGQSHWCVSVSVFHSLFELVDGEVRSPDSKLSMNMQQCKVLGKIIKTKRLPVWPTPLTQELPPKEVCDALVHQYLQTSETVFRVLHVPTFMNRYEEMWQSAALPPSVFLAQVKLVLAIGTVTYDSEFTMRTQAMKWVYEGHTFVSDPALKGNLVLDFVQANLLLLLAREATGVAEDFVWVSVGSVVRMAMFMGLHREPDKLPETSLWESELRRRLWNTILEINMQSSMMAGGSPMLALDVFDTNPPGNFDDDQLLDESSKAKPLGEFTQCSVAIALRKTYAARLAIVKFLNDIGQRCSYDETIRLDTNLRSAYKIARGVFDRYRTTNQFEVRVMDLIIQRFLMSLHMPFLGPSRHEVTYVFSRKVVLENAIKIWSAAYPKDNESLSSDLGNQLQAVEKQNLLRMIVCGGFLRVTVVQACLAVGMEVRLQLQEDQHLGLTTIRPDLLVLLDEAKHLSLRNIEVGETNMKGHLFVSLVVAHIHGLMRGLEGEELAKLLLRALEEAMDRALPILELQAGQTTSETNLNAFDGATFDTAPIPILWEDWDYILSAGAFNNLGVGNGFVTT